MIHLKSVDLKKEKIESLVIPVCEDKNIFEDNIIISLIKEAKKIKEFKGGKDDELVFYNLTEVRAERVIFIGLGKFEKIDIETFRAAAGKAVKESIKKKLSNVLIAVPSAKKINMEMTSLLAAMLEGSYLGNHVFDKYKKEKKHTPVKKINFLVTPEETRKYSRLSHHELKRFARGLSLQENGSVRHLTTKDPNIFPGLLFRWPEKRISR